ncbi:hypothetical protein [Stenotrophomonas rhizophila]|uniref:hypothetical protein n=1 Tax=Stenotrophomonas rhizophila TaxID=216778 RepID=UPI001E494205|nr:hypothetical protein [Stenotrophomonas rhizophila]MCC7632815.1 hypothetical protein [Stenotrophomonas rhizophila]MCC7662460.1 hypothetical protein [Stenotrophomonas rhizophila]
MKRLHRLLLATVTAMASPLPLQAQQAVDYSGMLSYLTTSRIDGRALSAADGAITVNMAAGDLNQQANLLAIANGDNAHIAINARQQHRANRVLGEGAMDASASIGGQALNGASGVVMINQASGTGNATLNVVAATLAQQGIRESSDEALAASEAIASAGGQGTANSGTSAGTRSVAVEATALQGLAGVLQLNQVAGSGNATANQLSISVQSTP